MYLRMLRASHRICQSKVTWGKEQFNLLIKKFCYFFLLLSILARFHSLRYVCVYKSSGTLLVLRFFRSFCALNDICYAHSVSTFTHSASIKRAEIRYLRVVATSPAPPAAALSSSTTSSSSWVTAVSPHYSKRISLVCRIFVCGFLASSFLFYLFPTLFIPFLSLSLALSLSLPLSFAITFSTNQISVPDETSFI